MHVIFSYAGSCNLEQILSFSFHDLLFSKCIIHWFLVQPSSQSSIRTFPAYTPKIHLQSLPVHTPGQTPSLPSVCRFVLSGLYRNGSDSIRTSASVFFHSAASSEVHWSSSATQYLVAFYCQWYSAVWIHHICVSVHQWQTFGWFLLFGHCE